MSCKCKSPEFWKGPTSVLFSDLLTLDYYDGPTTAVCKCAVCGAPKLLSVISWKPGLSPIRVFGVTAIASAQFCDIKEQALVQDRMIAAGESDPYSGYEAALSRLFRESPSPQIVLASADLKKEIIAARKLGDEGVTFANTIERISEEDFSKWLFYLGIAEGVF